MAKCESMPGHNDILSDLRGRMQVDILPNAIAISGATGWGIEWLGARIAAMLLDLGESESIDLLQQIRDLAHPDLRWIEPDGAELKIDQIRALNDFAVQTAQGAGRKVAVLCGAETLNENAANALLKTLEEPPADTHLLLLTYNWGRLLPTIRSRTQRWTVPSNHDAGIRWMKTCGIELDSLEFELLGAAPLDIWQRQNQSHTDPKEDQVRSSFDITAWLVEAGRGPVSQSAKDAAEQDTAELLSLWYRRIKLHLSQHPLPELQVQARVLHAFCDELLSVRRQLLTRNSARSSANLLLEGLIIEWRRIVKGSAR